MYIVTIALLTCKQYSGGQRKAGTSRRTEATGQRERYDVRQVHASFTVPAACEACMPADDYGDGVQADEDIPFGTVVSCKRWNSHNVASAERYGRIGCK